MKRFLMAAVTSCALMATGATASTLAGEFWDAPAVSLATIDDAITYAGSNASDATFTSTGIDYGNVATGWAIGDVDDFLKGDSPGGAAGTTDFQESVLKISGSVTLADGDSINVTSDDGFRLIIGGSTFTEFNGLRGPGGSTTGIWAGGAGTFAATLWYFEGNVTQAQLISNLGDYATVVPLPAGMVLMLTALGGLGVMRRRAKA